MRILVCFDVEVKVTSIYWETLDQSVSQKVIELKKKLWNRTISSLLVWTIIIAFCCKVIFTFIFWFWRSRSHSIDQSLNQSWRVRDDFGFQIELTLKNCCFFHLYCYTTFLLVKGQYNLKFGFIVLSMYLQLVISLQRLQTLMKKSPSRFGSIKNECLDAKPFRFDI